MNKRTSQPPSHTAPQPAATTAPAAAGLPLDSRTMNTRQLRQAVVAYCVGQQRSMEQILQHLVPQPGQPEQADRVRVAVYDMVRLGKMVNLSIIDGVRICKQGAYLAHDANLDAMAAHRLDFAPLVAAWLGPWHVQRLAGGGAAA